MDTLAVIRELAERQFGAEPGTVDPDLPLQDIGIDSLGYLEFLFELEDAVGVPIPPKDVTDVRTLRELASVVDRLIAERPAPAEPRQ
ncbi:MAG TPA: acyl carrier protein [Gemmatimonadaceae bacterium]